MTACDCRRSSYPKHLYEQGRPHGVPSLVKEVLATAGCWGRKVRDMAPVDAPVPMQMQAAVSGLGVKNSNNT